MGAIIRPASYISWIPLGKITVKPTNAYISWLPLGTIELTPQICAAWLPMGTISLKPQMVATLIPGSQKVKADTSRKMSKPIVTAGDTQRVLGAPSNVAVDSLRVITKTETVSGDTKRSVANNETAIANTSRRAYRGLPSEKLPSSQRTHIFRGYHLELSNSRHRFAPHGCRWGQSP